MRDTIFIGHATPEDNEFTLWLQSKLQNEGYKCECDLSFLIGGEADYWKNLQDFFEINSAKYILVISNITFNKQGVLDEWEHCKSIEKQYRLNDFIIPIKIDNSPCNARIGLNRRNIISFEENWAIGLKRLIRKLKNDNVPKEQPNNLSINDWYENVYTNWSGIEKDTTDTFFSNWVTIKNIPKQIYFYKFHNEEQANAVLENNMVYPAYRHGNIIVSFQKILSYYLTDKNFDIEPTETIVKNSEDAFTRYEEDDFPNYYDFRRLIVRLLNNCFERYLQDKELSKYSLSNSACYFFNYEEDSKKTKSKFQLNGKSKNIGVAGKYFDDYWHYAISFKALLYPELCFSIKNHIVFTDTENNPWHDAKKMHKARRDKGKNMRNKEWRDQLLAFLSLLSDNEDSEMIIPVAEDENIVLSTTPKMFSAPFSYIEPNDEERLKSIDDFVDEEEYYNEETIDQ